MAQIAKTEARDATDTMKQASDNVAELGKRGADRAEDAARRGADVLQRATGAAAEMEREVTHQAAEGRAKLGRVFSDLAHAQARHNLDTFKALAGAVAWDRVFQIRGEYLRVSLERAAQLTQRYLQMSQAVMTSAASAAATRRQARKAA